MKYDIIVKGGTLIDGTGAPGIDADVGVVGDSIAAIGDLKHDDASTVVDARGKIVAPGFIDIHGHSDYFLLVEPLAPNKLRQGVTTEVGGNCGYSAAPISKTLSDEREESLSRNFGIKLGWQSLKDYYSTLENIRPGVNFGILMGHNTLRASVMGGESRPPTPDEMNRMKAMAREGMADGALGISTGLIYPPACFSSSDEMAELFAEAKAGFFATHMRSEGNQLLESITEVVDVARKAGIRLQISHLKTSGKRNWHKMDQALRLIEEARASGVDARCDRYPYTSSFTGLSSALPSWVFEGTREQYRARLKVADVRARIRDEMNRDYPDGDYLNRIVIAQTFSEGSHHFEGQSVTDAAKTVNKEPLDFLLDILSEEKSDPTAIYHTMNEDNMIKALSKPYSMVGSDSAARAPGSVLGEGKPHPRAYGCFPRFLKLVREKKFVSIERAVAMMTGDTAAFAGLARRGLLQKGYFADIAVFDFDKVEDRGTYDNPHQFSVGFSAVIVNGKFAVRDDELTGKRAGAVLRRSA